MVRDIVPRLKPARASPPRSARRLGFAERLVWFWSNHFCVSADKVPSFAGAYEREAIRPHVLGRFADMLLAVRRPSGACSSISTTPPRSDRIRSPASTAAAGLNENLAREILELHTLGVRTGYTQDDVTSFAKVLTGWSFTGAQVPEHGGEFVIRPAHARAGRADRARQKLSAAGYRAGPCGADRPCASSGDGTSTSPTSWRVISWPMSRRRGWSSDWRKTFRATDGNLKEMARVLVTSPEAWDTPRGKLKSPTEWIMASLRAAGAEQPSDRALAASACTARPAAVAAAGAEGIFRRARAPGSTAWRRGSTSPTPSPAEVAEALDPPALVDEMLGPLASVETRQTIDRAESRTQAFALLLMSPEFQTEVTMTLLHAPSRREILLASGVLFAWARLPKLARAEGRDPRMLVIVLRGALDGLAAVAPVGDPDWVKLRGDKALALDGKTPGAAARRVLRAQSGDAEPASALQGRTGDHRPRRGDALSRALALRRPGRAGKRRRQGRRCRHRLAQPGAQRARARGSRQFGQPQGPGGRPGDAAGGARAGAGDVMGAAAPAAGER